MKGPRFRGPFLLAWGLLGQRAPDREDEAEVQGSARRQGQDRAQAQAPGLPGAALGQELGLAGDGHPLGRRILAADGMLLASPEYNYSLPGHLKNAIDWLSRIRPVPIRGKSALVMSASTGPIGGIRGLWQLRIPLEGLGMHVHPDMYIVPHGNDAFTPDGGLKDLKAAERLDGLIRDYVAVARALNLAEPHPTVTARQRGGPPITRRTAGPRVLRSWPRGRARRLRDQAGWVGSSARGTGCIRR